MEKYNYTIIEDWWRHLGTYDLELVTGISRGFPRTDESEYRFEQAAKEWWESLTDEEKLDIYNEFFEE